MMLWSVAGSALRACWLSCGAAMCCRLVQCSRLVQTVVVWSGLGPVGRCRGLMAAGRNVSLRTERDVCERGGMGA